MYYNIAIFHNLLLHLPDASSMPWIWKFSQHYHVIKSELFEGFSNHSNVDEFVINSTSGCNCNNYKLNSWNCYSHPHKIQPSYRKSSSFLVRNGLSCVLSARTVGQPCYRKCTTCENTAFRWVPAWIWATVTGELSKCSANNTNTGGVFAKAGSTGSGKRLSASALLCVDVFQTFKLYSNNER